MGSSTVSVTALLLSLVVQYQERPSAS